MRGHEKFLDKKSGQKLLFLFCDSISDKIFTIYLCKFHRYSDLCKNYIIHSCTLISFVL